MMETDQTTLTAIGERNWLGRLAVWTGIYSLYFLLAVLIGWRPILVIPLMTITSSVLGKWVPAQGRVINTIAVSLSVGSILFFVGIGIFRWNTITTFQASAVTFYLLLLLQVFWRIGKDRAANKQP